MPLRELPSDVPTSLEKALAKAMQTNPDHRYLTALEFADALAATVEAGPRGGSLLGRIKEKLK